LFVILIQLCHSTLTADIIPSQPRDDHIPDSLDFRIQDQLDVDIKRSSITQNGRGRELGHSGRGRRQSSVSQLTNIAADQWRLTYAQLCSNFRLLLANDVVQYGVIVANRPIRIQPKLRLVQIKVCDRVVILIQ